MHPLLFKIGSIPIHTYGVMIALGFLAAMVFVRVYAPKSGLDPEKSIDLAFILVVGGFIGARTIYILTRWDYFSANPIDMFKVWEGGLVLYGGPIASISLGYYFTRKYKLPFWKLFDVYIQAFVLAHMFGRFGCFGAGCCYGLPTDAPWGVAFNGGLVPDHLRGIHLHPTQLYEAFSLMILLLGLNFVYHRRKFDGQVGLTYLMTYPIIRSIIEEFRGDKIRGFVIEGVLSTSQFISIIVFMVGAVMLFRRLKKVKALAEGA